MSTSIDVDLLSPDEWQRLREIRLRALKESPMAFGAKLNEERAKPESAWRERYAIEDYLVASIGEHDVGMLYVEVLKGDHGATCWVGGCWSDPRFRGKGIMRALFNFIDANAIEKGWQRQGLGVYVDNESATKTYEALGFRFIGEKFPSGDRPDRFFTHMVRGTPHHS